MILGLREILNRYTRASIGGVCAVLLVTVVFGYSQMKPGKLSAPSAYFSADDGKTFYADDSTIVAPFESHGQPVYGAQVFECADGKRFVGYLERAVSPEAKKIVEEGRRAAAEAFVQHPTAGPGAELMNSIRAQLEIKKPGETKWVPANSPEADRIYAVKCADGSVPSPAIP